MNYELQGERKKLNKPYLGFKVCTQGGGGGRGKENSRDLSPAQVRCSDYSKDWLMQGLVTRACHLEKCLERAHE